MESDTVSWLGDTRRVVKVGDGLCVNIKKDIQHSLGIVQGTIIQFKVRNTGKMAEKINRHNKNPPEPVKEEPKVIPV